MSCIVTLCGVIGRKPKKVENGAVEIAVKTVSLVAMADGVYNEDVQWHRVIITSRRMINGALLLADKGSHVVIVGRLVYRGNDRQAYIVVGNDTDLSVRLTRTVDDNCMPIQQLAPDEPEEQQKQAGGEPIGRVIVDASRNDDAVGNGEDYVPF